MAIISSWCVHQYARLGYTSNAPRWKSEHLTHHEMLARVSEHCRITEWWSREQVLPSVTGRRPARRCYQQERCLGGPFARRPMRSRHAWQHSSHNSSGAAWVTKVGSGARPHAAHFICRLNRSYLLLYCIRSFLGWPLFRLRFLALCWLSGNRNSSRPNTSRPNTVDYPQCHQLAKQIPQNYFCCSRK